MSAHTPGPWSEVRDSGPAATKTPEWWVYADNAPYKLVTICQGPDAKANARLIAAAPALLAALEGLRGWCDANLNGVPTEYGQRMDAADAAIRAAKEGS